MATPPNINEITAVITKAFEDFNTATTNYVSAATKSSAAMWKGVEEITRSVGGMAQESFARGVSAYTTLSAAKTPQEVASTHADFVKDSFDSAVASGGKVSEISVRTAQEAINPLAQQTNETISAVMKKHKPE